MHPQEFSHVLRLFHFWHDVWLSNSWECSIGGFQIIFNTKQVIKRLANHWSIKYIPFHGMPVFSSDLKSIAISATSGGSKTGSRQAQRAQAKWGHDVSRTTPCLVDSQMWVVLEPRAVCFNESMYPVIHGKEGLPFLRNFLTTTSKIRTRNWTKDWPDLKHNTEAKTEQDPGVRHGHLRWEWLAVNLPLFGMHYVSFKAMK